MKTMNDIIEYCQTLPGIYVDNPFDETSTAIRHTGNKKMLLLMFYRNDSLWVNLKCEPMKADFWRRVYKSVIPGYHMNKTHWNSVILDESIEPEVIKEMINDSYDLTKGKLKL